MSSSLLHLKALHECRLAWREGEDKLHSLEPSLCGEVEIISRRTVPAIVDIYNCRGSINLVTTDSLLHFFKRAFACEDFSCSGSWHAWCCSRSLTGSRTAAAYRALCGNTPSIKVPNLIKESKIGLETGVRDPRPGRARRGRYGMSRRFDAGDAFGPRRPGLADTCQRVSYFGDTGAI